ncbi:MAG: adenylate/guanylate cyclase domain-containing protein [Pseudomonadales bacterium]|nr:adenylate/guanylate cyclase domain-containing protein [Pseudomonadales bacterium]
MPKTNNRYDLLAVIFLFLLAMIFEYREAFSLLEDEMLSYRQLMRTYYADPEVTEPIEDVLIVFTDEAFYEEYDKYPLRRVDLSTLIIRLAEMNASVIGVDMLLDFNSAYGEDPTLADAFAQAGNVLLVSQAQFEGDEFQHINTAIPRFDELTSNGYSNISSNSAVLQSIVRLRVYPEIAAEGTWPFAVQAVANYLGTEPELDGQTLRFGDLEVALDQFNDLYIDYPLLRSSGDGGTVKLHDVTGIPASEILFAHDAEELEDLSYLVDGRIILIGEVAEVAHDEFETPVGNVFGVEIIANTITTLLKGAPLRAAPFWVEFGILLALMLLFVYTRTLTEPLRRNGLSLGAIILFLVLNGYFYIYSGLVISMSYALIASVLAMIIINARFYLAEMGQKAQIRDMFGQYLSPKVVADLVKDPEKLSLGGEEREMTAFFSDIAGFSSFSEKMTPTELVNALNDYLTAMCQIIVDLEGTVDKFEGDAIIAFWGAPAIQLDHATQACFAAIDMQKAVHQIRDRFVEEGRPAISVRMGLNTGRMVVGNMGSAQRMDYTIMGDSVNLASRLEGANKAYGSDIMISGMTYEACKDEVDVRELDTIRVVGKNEPVTVYQLLERKGQTDPDTAALVARFHEALDCYKARDYQGALAGFEACVAMRPEDGPSGVYAKRCAAYIESPPAADWDGVFVLTDKG